LPHVMVTLPAGDFCSPMLIRVLLDELAGMGY
jgi:hypothetical protein